MLLVWRSSCLEYKVDLSIQYCYQRLLVYVLYDLVIHAAVILIDFMPTVWRVKIQTSVNAFLAALRVAKKLWNLELSVHGFFL